MPRRPKYTKEELLNAALTITREEGFGNVCARTLGERLGTAPATVFTHYESVESIREATIEAAHEVYCKYVEEGLAMDSPFKGFGMQYMKFAIEEPNLFQIVFMRKFPNGDLTDYLVSEGNYEKIIAAIKQSFSITDEQAEYIYRNLMIYAHGMGSMIATGGIQFSEEQISDRLGCICRDLVLGISIPTEERRKYVAKTKDEK